MQPVKHPDPPLHGTGAFRSSFSELYFQVATS